MQSDRLFTRVGVTESDRLFHTPSEFARKNLLYVQEVGHLSSIKPHRCVREKLDSFLIMLVLSGKGKLYLGAEEYELKSGDIAFIDCMEHYEHVSDENDAWKLGWIHFNGVQARGYYELFYQCNKESNVVTPTTIEEYDALIKRIIESQEELPIKAERKAGAEILNLLNMLIDELDNSDEMFKKEERERVNAAREQINLHYMDKDILERTLLENKEFSGFEESFKAHFGISMNDYLIFRRLNGVKELLRFTVDSVDEIAPKTGLKDAKELEELFESYEHMSPDEYRGKWAGWIRN